MNPTPNTTPHTDPALRRVQQHINRSAGQHKRAISEGTRSAREILKSTPITADPLLLHRVDTSQMPRDAGCAVGHMALASKAGDKHHPECGYGTCAMHPECTSRCGYREADRALRGHYCATAASKPTETSKPGALEGDGFKLALQAVGLTATAVALGALVALFIK